tara:strand:+ start:5177 stop:7939 length:2763 start_codon:yes stop_codon:yes gene_type:complete
MALTKITSNVVKDDAVTSAKIVDGGIATADIATNAVTSTKIAQNSILTKHIDDGQVTTAQLGADAVTAAKIADDAISEEHLDITVITSLTEVTAATGDLLMVADVSDSNNLKKIPVSSILAGTHTGAINTSGTISSGAITSSGNIVSTSNTATQFKNATDTDVQNKFETNSSADYALHRLIGSDGVDNKFIIGYGPNHPSTPNHMALKNSHASGSIGFNTSASSTERMRIDSSGNVLVGTTDSSLWNNGAGGNTGTLIESDGTIQLAKSSNITAYFNRLDSDGDIVSFRKNGSAVGSIGTDSGSLVIGGGDVGIGFYQSANALVPINGGTRALRDSAIDLGLASGGKFKNLYLSGTISSGAITSSGNITASGNLHAGDGTNINMDSAANGQLEVDGNGYQGAIALNDTAMHIYHNSSIRSLIIGTNETARLTFGGSGNLDFHSNNLASVGTISSGAITSSGNITMTAAADRRIFMGGQAGATFGLAYDSDNPNYGIFYTEASPDVVNISPNGSATAGTLRVLGNGQIEATGGNLYLTGNIDRRIKLSDSGNAGLSDSDNTVHIRANDDDLILNAAGNGTIRFKENGTEHLSIDKDGYAKFNSTRSEYGAEFKSAGSRSGFVLKKPGTDSIMGSVLMLSNEDFRLGTASHYHIRMAQNGDTYMGNTENAHFTETGALRITTSAGYNQLRLESNATDNTNKTSGITSLMYTNNTCSIFQGFFQNGSNAVYWGSADGAHRGLQRHYFYVNDNYNATSGHKLVMTLASSSSTALVVNGNNSTGGTVNWIADSNKGSNESHCHYGSNGDWYIRPASNSGYVYVKNYQAESDERLKTNIADITYGTTELLQLRPRKFNWKEGGGEQNGFIAQEVETVIPAFVKTGEMKIDGQEEEDGIKSVDYNSIVATLVKTVQELEARLKTLEG